MPNKIHILLLVIVCTISSVFILEACRKKDVFIGTPLQFKIPAGWPQPTEFFVNNPVNEETFQLGRKLFYEGKLSKMEIFPVPPVTSPLHHIPLFSTTGAMATIIHIPYGMRRAC